MKNFESSHRYWQSNQRKRLPLALRGVVLGISLALLADIFIAQLSLGFSIFGFNLTSLGWLVPLFVSTRVLLNTSWSRISFPIQFWLPWISWVVSYQIIADEPNSLQRSIMLLTPIVIGMAVSTIQVDQYVVHKFKELLDKFLWLFLIAAGMATGLVTNGQLSAVSNFAAGSITASLLATWYAVRFITFEDRRDMFRWAMLIAVPVLANSRTGILAVAITLPLTFTPWSVMRRLVAICVTAMFGLFLFQTEHIQSKMFYSGQGSILDAIDGILGLLIGKESDTGDFENSGRSAVAEALRDGIPSHYWFGHGSNVSESVTLSFEGLTHPHNDWLRLQFDYGTLGMALFALTLFVQSWHALFLTKLQLPVEFKLFLYVGASAFLPMVILMSTDNVILYAAWFGCLHFSFLGLGYAAVRNLSIPYYKL